MKSLMRILFVLLLVFAVPVAAMTSCAKSSEQAIRYHCPMHPTYISDKPGDCPICGMRLVPIDEKKGAASPGSPHSPPSNPDHAPTATGQMEHKLLHYRSPMDPKITSPTPTKDSMGMDFVPVYADEVANVAGAVPGLASIDVSAEGLRLAGVRTAVAEQGRISRTIRAVGVVRADETRVRHVHTKISGWIEKLYVNFTGEPVAAGRPILTIYSQELLAAQHEYLQAKKASGTMQSSDLSAVREGADDMVTASRRRLELLDVPKSLIAGLDRGGEVSRTVTITSPVGGIVMAKNVFEGQEVNPGMELFMITDLSRVWIEADIYESEMSAVHLGQEAKITFMNDPGSVMTGKIKYIFPYLNAETRTLRVRFNFANPGLKLKLESYANVEIPVETDEGAIVLDSAIMDTGVRQVVYVNTGEGRFEPRLVKLGIRSDGRAQILSGVSPGERVAVKANFLLDSESRLRAAMVPETPAPEGSSAAVARAGSPQ